MNEILKRIDEAKHIVVISHVNPDADSIGSASAVYTHLLRLHKKVSWFCATKNINPKLAFLPWFEKIRNSFASSADLAISLDCGDIKRLGTDLECDLINIDHHRSNSEFGEFNLIDKNSISTTKVLYDFLKKSKISINSKMATALYAGLLDDSNGFLSEMLDSNTFMMAKELIESGADYKMCNSFIMKYQSLASFRLKAIMHKNMKLFFDARVAVICVSDSDMKESGAIGQDCESVLEESLYLPSVEVALLLRENSDLSLKGSLRSSSSFDVSKIASTFSGGGHERRAGFNIDSSFTLEQAQEKILKLIYEEM